MSAAPRPWEEWPGDGPALTWHDGRPTDVDLPEWAAIVPTFLGCGFRLRFPGSTASVEYSRRLARRVADRLGVELDDAPWDHLAQLAPSPSATEVTGGWGYGLDRRLGAPWTRATRDGPGRLAPRTVAARSLPWAHPSEAPTAGLPMISRLEAHRAEAALDPAEPLGLWWNRSGELCATTAGPPLLRAAEGWLFPDESSGLVPTWALHTMVERLGASPARITRERLTADTALVAVSDVGNVTIVSRADGVDLAPQAAGPLLS